MFLAKGSGIAITSALVVAAALSGCVGPQLQPEERLVEKVYDAKGHSKGAIFSGARTWIAENFRSAKSVIEYENRDEGVIIGNGVMPYPCQGASCLGKEKWKVSFTMRFESKDDRFKMSFTNLKIFWPSSYAAGFSSPAGEGGVNLKNEMDDIKPRLLAFGDQVVASLGKNKANSAW